jgi:hypothetical protein
LFDAVGSRRIVGIRVRINIITMDSTVDEYIENQKSPQKEICMMVRQIIFKTFPNIKEQMKWGVPSYDDGKYYFVALNTHINMGFSLKGLSKEEISLLKGGGKTMKHIELHSVKEIEEKKIVTLLRMVKDK